MIKVILKWKNGTTLTRTFDRKSEAIIFAVEAKDICTMKNWSYPDVKYENI